MLSEKEISPVNYDPYKNRKRRQDHHQKKRIKENGSFFIFKTEGFLNSKNRMFGEIGYFLQDKLESIEIDEINASAEYESKLEEAINTVFEEDEEDEQYDDRYDDD